MRKVYLFGFGFGLVFWLLGFGASMIITNKSHGPLTAIVVSLWLIVGTLSLIVRTYDLLVGKPINGARLKNDSLCYVLGSHGVHDKEGKTRFRATVCTLKFGQIEVELTDQPPVGKWCLVANTSVVVTLNEAPDVVLTVKNSERVAIIESMP